jgi:hypothetical protein
VVFNSIQINLHFLIFIQCPIVVNIVFVVISSRVQFEIYRPILFCPVEFHFPLLLPFIPISRYAHVFWPWNSVRFIYEFHFFTIQFFSVRQHSFKCLPDIPVLAPKLALLSDIFHLLFLLYLIISLNQTSNLFFNSVPININFILQSIKLSIPSLSHIFFFNNAIEGILS